MSKLTEIQTEQKCMLANCDSSGVRTFQLLNAEYFSGSFAFGKKCQLRRMSITEHRIYSSDHVDYGFLLNCLHISKQS